LISVKELTKRYGAITAVNGVSFEVSAGEILGFLGPNGAGKTTTMNILAGYIAPTSGSCAIDGLDIVERAEEARERVGYLPENPPLYNDMTVWEYLNFAAEIKKVDKKSRKRAVEDIMEKVEIADMRGRLNRNLSKGYRQRVGLAQALIADPAVIILDEPTVGLDPQQVSNMRGVIRELRERHTVILSSHILSEISAMCDRVLIINRGRVAANDAAERLSGSLSGGGRRYAARIRAGRAEALAALSPLEGAGLKFEYDGEREGGASDVTIIAGEGLQTDPREAVFGRLAEAGLPLLMLKPLDVSLEDIFIQVTARDILEGEAEEPGEAGENTREGEEAD
jgi:ABC-2 type transport system ATP-binding protein